MKDNVVYRVTPNKALDRWAVVKEGKKALKPKAKGLSRGEALEVVKQMARRKTERALVLIHKTRYIVERQLEIT